MKIRKIKPSEVKDSVKCLWNNRDRGGCCHYVLWVEPDFLDRNEEHEFVVFDRHQPVQRGHSGMRVGKAACGIRQRHEGRPGARRDTAGPAGLPAGDEGFGKRRVQDDSPGAVDSAGMRRHGI